MHERVLIASHVEGKDYYRFHTPLKGWISACQVS